MNCCDLSFYFLKKVVWARFLLCILLKVNKSLTIPHHCLFFFYISLQQLNRFGMCEISIAGVCAWNSNTWDHCWDYSGSCFHFFFFKTKEAALSHVLRLTHPSKSLIDAYILKIEVRNHNKNLNKTKNDAGEILKCLGSMSFNTQPLQQGGLSIATAGLVAVCSIQHIIFIWHGLYSVSNFME